MRRFLESLGFYFASAIAALIALLVVIPFCLIAKRMKGLDMHDHGRPPGLG